MEIGHRKFFPRSEIQLAFDDPNDDFATPVMSTGTR